MYRCIGAALLLASATGAQAQTQTTVSGVVANRATGQPLPAASVAVVDKKSGAPLTGALTDASGRFVITGLPPAEYTLSASLAGFEASSQALLIGTRNTIYNLGEIGLAPTAAVDALVVTAGAAAAVEIGTSTFRMDANVARSGGSVLDAMKSLPGITISDEGQVMLRGSDRVPVLVDGRPSALTGFGNQSALDSIPAANIDRIEIINNPSARFDAAGMAGIVNIVYKTDKKLGLHGDVGLAYGLGVLEKRKADVPSPLGSYTHNPRVAPSLNLTYNRETASFFAQAEYINRADLPNNEFTTRFYNDGRVRYSQIPENRHQTRVILKGGVDWRPDEVNSFSLSSLYDREHHIDKAQIPFLDQRFRQLRYWFWRENEVTGLFNLNGTWKRQLGAPGHQISLNLQFTRAWEDETYDLNEVSPVRVGTDQTRILAIEKTLPVSLDYVRPLASGRLEAGLKFQSRRIPDTYTVRRGAGSIIYPGLGDTSKWSETIYAAYANLVIERPRWAVEGGARGEKTAVSYEIDPRNIYYPRSDKYDYAKLFINARVTYNLSEKTRLSVFYNNRVDRPGEAELRIFPKYDDPELLKVGNPYLRPQFTKTYEARLQHDWTRGTLSLSAFHRSITDPFTRVYAIDPTNTTYEIINKIFHNTGHATNTGLELLASRRFGSGVNLSGSFNWYRNKLDAFDVPLLFPVPRTLALPESKDTTWDLKLNGQARLPWNVQVQASAVYYAARNIAQGRLSARSSLDLSISKKLMENRAEVVLSATDILNNFGVEQEIVGDGFTAIYQNFYQTQAVNLAVKYSF